MNTPVQPLFEITAKMADGSTLPYGYAFSQGAASISAQAYRRAYCYGKRPKQPRFNVVDFTTRPVRGEIKGVI